MDREAIENTVREAADRYFGELGYKGAYPDYCREIPGKMLAVNYRTADDDGDLRLKIRYVTADKKAVNRDDAGEIWNCDTLIIASGMRARERNLSDLPFVSESTPEKAVGEKINEMLVMIPVTDRLVSREQTPADKYAAKCVELAAANRAEYESSLEFWEDSKKQADEDFKRAVLERTKTGAASIIVFAVIAAVIAFAAATVSAFGFLREFRLADSVIETASQWYPAAAAGITLAAGVAGGFIGRYSIHSRAINVRH